MTETTENLILEHLRLLRNDIASFRTDTNRKFDELNTRLGLVEGHIVGIKRELVLVHEAIAAVHVRLDNHERRLERIERRLELREEAAP